MRVAKWGNSLAVRIPAAMARELNLKKGDEVVINISRASAPLSSTERKALLRKLRKFRGMMPADFKFDREEAHQRGLRE